jgi:hypothetical protein
VTIRSAPPPSDDDLPAVCVHKPTLPQCQVP